MDDKIKQDAWKAHVKNDLRIAIDLLEEAEARVEDRSKHHMDILGEPLGEPRTDGGIT